MTQVLEALALAGALCLAFAFLKYRNRAIGTTSRPDLKGPRGWPIVGNLVDAVKYESRMMEWTIALQQNYGYGWTLTVPGVRMVDVSRPDWLQYVNKDNNANYGKGDMFVYMFGDVFGKGVFLVDGRPWHVQRKTAVNMFSTGSFKSIIDPAVGDCVSLLSQIVAQHAASGDNLDFSTLLFNFTLENFVKIAFGQRIGALRLGGEDKIPFSQAFDFAGSQLNLRFQIFYGWQIYEALSSRGRKMRKAIKCMNDFAYRLIDDRLTASDHNKDIEKDAEGPKRERDLLDLYLDARDDQGKPFTRQQLRDAVLNFVLAGRDTTAQAVSWLMWRLVSSGSHWQPIREEIDRVLGEDGRVSYDNHRSLVYVLACFNETLRLHPSAGKNGRFAVKADQIPNGGPRVEAGDFLRWNLWAMARNPEVWGPDCSEYKPSRWIDEAGRLRQFGTWQFHSFGGGPRQCLGMSLATFEAICLVVELVRNFDFDFAPGWWESAPKTVGVCDVPDELLYGNALTLTMAAPLVLTARKRAA